MLHVIKAKIACYSCRTVTPNADIAREMTSSSVFPTHAELLRVIDPESMTCFTCEQTGYCEVQRAELDGFVYDFERSKQPKGQIDVIGEKERGKTQIRFCANSPTISTVDYLNTANALIQSLTDGRLRIERERGARNGQFLARAWIGARKAPAGTVPFSDLRLSLDTVDGYRTNELLDALDAARREIIARERV